MLLGSFAKMTAASKSPAMSSSPAAKSVDCCRWANVTLLLKKLSVESPKVSLGTPVLATEVVKKDSPKPGAFFGKGGGGGGAMIPAAALERRSPANQFSSSPSFSSPRNPKGVELRLETTGGSSNRREMASMQFCTGCCRFLL
uniref:Uncharacterized protein n=1 Tax=Ditylenchus dipsaci TaxID=166011 RepID=A0A915DXW4_9BILA